MKNDLTQYSNCELSMMFMNVETDYLFAKQCQSTSDLRDYAESVYKFTENQWLELEADFTNGILD